MKEREKHDRIILETKTKLNIVEDLISKADFKFVSHNELASTNNLLNEYDDMKEKIKNSSNIKSIFFIINF